MDEYFVCVTMNYSHLVQSQVKDVKFSATISILFVQDPALLLCANSDVLVGVVLLCYADFCLTLGRTSKLIPTAIQGGGGGGAWQEFLPWVFVGLRYFEKVIPPIDSLLCRLHD